MKKVILFVSIIMALFLRTIAFAEDCHIECATEVTSQNVCISGKITNVTESHQVTLLVGEPDNILYIDQVATADDGAFIFNFGMPDTLNSGSYNFRIGSNSSAETYEGVLEYTTNNRIGCKVSIENQEITISGRIVNVEGVNQVTLLVGNVDNILYIDQKATEADGRFSFTFKLADEVNSGTYNFKIGSSADVEPYEGILEYTVDSRIVCQTTINERNVSISGQILNASSPNDVNLLVGDPSNVIYTSQTTSTNDGNFNFAFALPITLPSGTYNFTVATDAEVASYNGVLIYESTVEVIEDQFFDADITIVLSNYVPTLTGTMSCVKGKSITFTAVDKSDNAVIVQDRIIANDNHNLSYTLPSIATGKDYRATISCQEGEKILFSITVDIDSIILAVTVSGNVQVAENVRLDARAKTSNSNLIDKSASIDKNRELSLTIPNLVANVSCDISMQGYETMPKKPAVDLFTKLEKFKIEWLYTATVEKFYSAGGNLYSYINNSELKLSEDIEAKFIVNYGNHIYFSNMRENGRIYRCNKDGSNLTLVSEDSGSWLYIKNGNLYYKDNGNNREEKCVNISAE